MSRPWFAAAVTATLLGAVLLVGTVYISTRTVVRDGVSCGSVVKPMSAAVKGPPGTNPTPCAHAHTADRAVAVLLVAVVGALAFGVARARPTGSSTRSG